ncbi:hypothetical protein FHG64_17420 [Antarcticibacterium flavum]|uniref:HEAT repeat domain-containing protein n=1 Tax=Antarcticibacterium flavum TaxID=2058175 RepID=A0A5B7X8C5_9FLAO|nr:MULTISPECIES: hypothetical protein [Antarcticibacterium]MCM4159255.1 hypothetical protein [Antarcticibacterium sp. W02-3]QCY71032.1 hypothetical protein FHG64_17420 [Antarcticibacterium flavum]
MDIILTTVFSPLHFLSNEGLILYRPLVASSEGLIPFYFTVRNLLLLVIFCLVAVSLLFFLMTLYKKVYRIREIRKKKEYQEQIDELLFKFLFDESSVSEMAIHPFFKEHNGERLFQQLTIKALIGLHHNYSGIYSKKLEQFFAESGLAAYSLSKLNSANWAHIVEGIRDLSSLKYLPAYPRIVSYKNHPNSYVQTEVLLGMIKLKGISELLKFKNSGVYFNDWIQSNILFVVKNYRIPAPANLDELLESRNRSVFLLAVRLMNYYSLPEHYEALTRMFEKMDDKVLKKEMSLLLNKTEQLQ